ncbi:MAG: hypothetical protein ACRDT8_06885 [Micromonosporaceae bacterium]
MRRTRADYEREQLERRLEVIQLPVTPLRHHGYLAPADRWTWDGEPDAVGVADDGTAYVVWPSLRPSNAKSATVHPSADGASEAVRLETELRPSFVQPLGQGRILLAAARTRGEPNAEVWTFAGELVTRGQLGDAIEHCLTTASGKLWVGYFDEALSGEGPQSHGLARFTADFGVDWLYPFQELPPIVDCYALNVDGETAHCYAYTDFHIVSISDADAADHGPAPKRSASRLLVAGDRAVLIGGSRAEYDLVTPLRIDTDGIHLDGQQRRLVLPDGLEAQRLRYVCRGADLHAFAGATWYRISLEDLLAASD